MPKPLIILVGGATGVGTTTIGGELLPRTRIKVVENTDYTREVLRNVVNPKYFRRLATSTYKAGMIPGYEKLSEEEQESLIIEGYRIQALDVQHAYDDRIYRALKENKPMVVEGVHVLARDLSKHPIELMQKYQDRIMQVLVDIEESNEHQQRFMLREMEAPERKAEKYLQYFKEIRWIRDYMVKEAKKYNAMIVDNSKDIDHTLNQILFEYYKRALEP